MAKPDGIHGYRKSVSDACEQTLVTLLANLGPWKDSVYLIGGLAPRYIIKSRPPVVPAHAGTGDVDIVVDMAILGDIKAYRSLETNIRNMGFTRATDAKGKKQSWRWQSKTEDGTVLILELLTDAPNVKGGRLEELPTEGNISAINIPHSSLVYDLHETQDITAELLNGDGLVTETIRFANIVSFTCLKAFAMEHRTERKDPHDLVYCIEHFDGGIDAVQKAFLEALTTKHADVIREAFGLITARFLDDDTTEGYRKVGPVQAAKFEDIDEDDRERTILRQRQVSEIVTKAIGPLIGK
jgi:hypothetical protein